MKQINQINTACKNCIFANYQDITQIGCKINELDKLRNNNIEILDAYDEEKEFYVINANKCFKYRTSHWNGSSLSLREQQKKISKEISIKYHAIIFANNNIQDIKDTLDSLMSQSLLPVYITIVRYSTSNIKPIELYDMMKNINIKWRIENVINEIDDDAIIDIIVPFVTVPIYTIFYAGFKVPKYTFSRLNYKIHNKFLNFAVILPNSTNNGKIVSRFIHTYYQGNKDISLIKKLESEQCPLIQITKLFPSFPI